MSSELPAAPLKGSKALVVGVANQYSIAYGCAKAFRELGAELALTYVNEKTKTYVEPLAKELEAPIFMPLDVGTSGMLEAVFERITREWASSTSSFIRSPSHRRKTCAGRSSTVPPRASSRRWTSPVTHSCA